MQLVSRKISFSAALTCPAFMTLPQRIRLAATARSASGATYTGHLPPSSRVTGVRCLVAAAWMILPTAVLPV